MDEGVLAEELGFDAFYLAEHAFVEHGRPSPTVSLSYIAARTSRIRLGTAVSVLTWHNPWKSPRITRPWISCLAAG